ncbi:MAG: J domain-containing protein [Burkholderiales bacterium]|nr:J domain-containing protein [Burkholderiales bacterium]
MSKIHTHYDNLKVSRMAPQEVIRAAYKALSQKYHPDKNPGDEKAARIMAILNSAYGTLSDPQRRREHDEWIAAEEWEIEWLESTKAEEEAKRDEHYAPQWVQEPPQQSKFKRRVRTSLWVALSLTLGWGAAVFMQWQFQIIPASNVMLSRAEAVAAPKSSAPTVLDNKPQEPKITLNAQLYLLGQDVSCSAPLRSEFAPNGEVWPAKSGYIEGYKVANGGGDVKIVLDNSANHSDTMITLIDQGRHQEVRHLLVKAQEKFTIENLLAANYEVRQQVLGISQSAKLACESEPVKSESVKSPSPAATVVSPANTASAPTSNPVSN